MNQTSIISLVICAGCSLQAGAAVEVSEINKLGLAMKNQIATHDETGTIEMKVTEADATAKVRKINYSRLNDHENHYTLMRMQEPKDMKGMAILSVIKNDQEEKWVYLPASKQTRKISSSDGNARVLDSELYTEDFDLSIVKTSDSRITEKKPDGSMIVETKIPEKHGTYGKTVSIVGANNLVKHSDVFDKKGVLLKTIDFQDYDQVNHDKWRATRILIKNVQNKRTTELTLSNLKMNTKLGPNDFSTHALAEDF